MNLKAALKVAAAILSLLIFQPAFAQSLRVYGPGGPAPAMKEAARIFGREHDMEVVVTAGPTPEWAAAMKGDGDLVYSGSEAMMGDFIATFGAVLNPDTVRLLYLRPAGILVRPGNPKKIRGFADLLAPGMRIAVVDGAGQQGMWEDIAGRNGDIATLRKFRGNIVRFAPNTAAALKDWQADPTIDAWLTFPIWSVAHPGIADIVPLDRNRVVFRDAGIVLTARGASNPAAKAFIAFLESPRGEAIFRKFGWLGSARR